MTITQAEPLHIDAVADVLARSCHNNPLALWLVPDHRRRLTVMTQFFSVLGADAIKAGVVDVVRADDGEPLGAAVWFNLTGPAADQERTPDRRLDDIFGSDLLPRWLTLDQAMTDNHLQGPHTYLSMIGVLPEMQGRGLGSRLLDHHHHTLGLDPAYLEATTASSMRLYERKGYVSLGELEIPGGPSLWRMWRPPQDALLLRPDEEEATSSGPLQLSGDDPAN